MPKSSPKLATSPTLSVRISVRISLKYCGSCNPRLSLRLVADHLAESARRLNIEVVPFSTGGFDTLVFLCGCPRACVVKPEIKKRAKHSLVIAGESLNGKPMRAEKLPTAIEEALVSLIQTNL